MSESQSGKAGEKSLKSTINVFIAWTVLVIALVLTGLYTFKTKQSVEDEFNKEFSFECNEIKLRVQTRLHAHAALLRTGAAYIEASDTVSRKEWDVFINHQKINKNLPGVQGIGYAMILTGELLEKHEQHIRASGFPQYKIMPAGKRNLYTTIIYLEPFSGRNLTAFGYDMFSEPVRREAMEKARDFDIASLSGKVNLVQENDTDVQSGMLLYVPVYRQGMPVNTLAERRKAIKGWSFSPYRMNDFMLGVLGNYETKLKGKVRMQIYDNDSIKPDALMFDSRSDILADNNDSGTLRMKLPLVFNEKHWTLYFSKALQFRSFYFHKDVYQVFLGGFAISFLIFILALLLLRNRYRLKLTTELARNLKENLDKHKALYNAIPDAVFVTDGRTGFIEEINQKASEQYGYTYDEFTTLNSSDILVHKRQQENQVPGKHTTPDNISHKAKYSPGREFEEKLGMPVAMIRLEDRVYSLTTGNLILNEDVEHLREKLDIINKYDKVGLKELFRKSLSGQTISSDSTGNMGLIDMARKSGSKLIYQFEKINDLYSYYTLTVKVEDKPD